MKTRKMKGCKRSEKVLLGLFVLLAATLLIGLSTPEESSVLFSLSLDGLSFGNGITGAAIGLQDPIVSEPVVENIVEEPVVLEHWMTIPIDSIS